MAFGILDDHKLANVPGTELLSDKNGNKMTAEEAQGLKRGTGKHSNIVLIPQPSNDPRDPLNWPRWKKEACFWTLVFTTSVGDALWGIATPAYVQLSQQFHVSVDEVASSFSGNFLGLAAVTMVQNPFSIKYGHRIVYLASTFLMFICCIWSAMSPDLGSLRASRIMQGFGEAAPRCLTVVTIEHLFFVHERGTRLYIWSLIPFVCSLTAGIVNGYVIQTLSWQLGFWFLSVACGLCVMGVFFFVPETTYRRDHNHRPREIPSKADVNVTTQSRASAVLHIDLHDDGMLHSSSPTYLSQLKVYNGTFSDESIWKIFLRPFPFILSPMTLFVFVCFAIPIVSLGIIAQCSSTIFTIEYGFSTTEIGLTNLTGIVGVALALLVTGPLNDLVIIQMSRRNRGIYEPEYRLVFMHAMVISVLAFAGWAVGNDHRMPWIGAIACLTMVYFAILIASQAPPFAYLIDTHGANRDAAAHIVALVNCAKSMVLYGATFFANRFILARGVSVFLLVLAACQAGCWLVSVAMYVFGKRVRSIVARHPRLFGGGLPCASERSPPHGQSKSEQ